MQWFEDWRMPRCFRTVEAGLGRAGLKVITNGTRFALLFCSRGGRTNVGCSGMQRGMQWDAAWDAADAINFFCEEGLIVTLIIHANRDSVRKARETHLIDKAKTLEPQGLNRRDELH